MTPHILVANVFFAPNSYGGATIVAEELAKCLEQSGKYRVSAVSLCMRGDVAAYAVTKTQVDGVTNYLINMPPHRTYEEMYDNPKVTDVLGDLMRSIEPDLVHAHCLQEMGTGVIAAADDLGIPVILSVHDFWWICERQFMIRADQTYCGQDPVRIENCRSCTGNFVRAKRRDDHLRRIAEKVDLITYPSAFAKSLAERSGFGGGKGVVLENGVRLPGEDFAQRQQARRLRDPRLSFGFLGGPSQIKGWPQIKQAFAGLARDDFRVCLVDGSLDGSWWSQEALGGLRGDWRIYPRFAQSDMDGFYAEIDVLLFMSQWKETFGLVIREAISRGIEVIQTDSGGTVEHGAVRRDRLIPIGADAGCLRGQITGYLDRGQTDGPVFEVCRFEQQAQGFARLADRVMRAKVDA